MIPKRRRIVHINLRLCFPDKSAAERTALAREHFALLGRSLLERGILWWGSTERLQRISRVEASNTFLPRASASVSSR